ncbi:uncharacterized protein sun2 isoform 1-T3 [Pholidichthys leucotaenia]
MSRRSSRLVAGGYYNSDEESDSSSVTNISKSYRENLVKVFKKKAGTRKPGSQTSSRANSNASSPGSETPVALGLSPSPSSSQTPSTMRTIPFGLAIATPRPALTPSSSSSQTPTQCPPVPSEGCPYSGLCSSSRPALHLRPSHNEPSHSGVDSSGYSSSEGTYRKPLPSTSKYTSVSGAPSTGIKSRITTVCNGLIDSASSVAASAHSKVNHLISSANTSVGPYMKKVCGLVLLFLIIILCIWLLLPLFTSVISPMTLTKEQSQTHPTSPPVIPAAAPPPPRTVHSTPVVDPSIVSAAVEQKIQPVLAELQLRHEQLISQIKERLQLDKQDMEAKLQTLDSESQRRLELEVTGLNRQMTDIHSDSSSATASLILRIQHLEAQNAKLSQELSSIQLMPSPAPCPETSTAPIHLTPELKQAIEKWFTGHIKEQDALRLGERLNCADCGRPMADKMADFALETQGASVISTRCSETYRTRSACVTLFGFPLWYPAESPRTVIQGYPVLLPGKCWAFHGVQGTLVISLSHPIKITHVTLDHLPRHNSPTGRIDSAPKDFEVYGMKNDTEEGTLLGTFTYNENGESTQTFRLPNQSHVVYRFVEMRVLSNWGHVEYTCLYRFRVHGTIP